MSTERHNTNSGEAAAHIRGLEPGDYTAIAATLDEWWGGRSMLDMLPRLFFEHFSSTSFACEHDGELVGFLIGFLSQSRADEAYIHFVGVHPAHRQQGVAQLLYERFAEEAERAGRRTLRCVTSPVNRGSIAFHTRLGFSAVPGPGGDEVDGVPFIADYDGPGNDRVAFVKHLANSHGSS